LFKQNQKTENMKKLFYVLVIAAAFTACNSESKEGTTETSTPATTETSASSTTETSASGTTETSAPASTDAAPSSAAK
jgi:hypothetical protein